MSFVTIDAPDAVHGTWAVSLNSDGGSVGYYYDSGGASHSWVRGVDGVITEFDPDTAVGSSANGINDSNVIAGTWWTTGYIHCFLATYDPVTHAVSGITSFSAPDSFSNWVDWNCINAGGDIVGRFAGTDYAAHGFIRSAAGDFTIFDIPALYQFVDNTLCINASGVVAGAFTDTDAVTHGFVRATDGTVTVFDPPGATITKATGIKDDGVIVGFYIDSDGGYHGFVRAAAGGFNYFDSVGSQVLYSVFINGDGVLAGGTADIHNLQCGFYRPGAVTKLFHILGPGDLTSPLGLNAGGVVVGYYGTDTNRGFIGTPDTFDPIILPPVRMKRIPLTVDLASCTYDQQNRVLQYEIYRALGPDPDKAGITSDPWKLPYTIVLRAWGEAVDDLWNILKGEPGEPVCGRRITIDPSVSPEWAGDYEIMELRSFAFQGDASLMSGGGTARSSATTVQPASGDSGTLELTLRTYNEDVMIEVSDDPTYATVPGADLADGGW